MQQDVYAEHIINKDTSPVIDYSNMNLGLVKNMGDLFYKKALNSKDKQERTYLLNKSAQQYYILANAEADNIENCIKLANIYDILEQDDNAKTYFYRALGINDKNPVANYYLGDFYCSRHNYIKALNYYNKAFSYGITPDAEKYKKLATVYEHLGDLTRAANNRKRAEEYSKK